MRAATLASPKIPEVDEILDGAADIIERDGHERGSFHGAIRMVDGRQVCSVDVLGAICLAAGLKVGDFPDLALPGDLHERHAAALSAARALIDHLGILDADPDAEVLEVGYLVRKLGYGWSDIVPTSRVIAQLRAAAEGMRDA